jgi:hypothetical protein
VQYCDSTNFSHLYSILFKMRSSSEKDHSISQPTLGTVLYLWLPQLDCANTGSALTNTLRSDINNTNADMTMAQIGLPFNMISGRS